MGIPPAGLAGHLWGLGKNLLGGHIDGDTAKAAGEVAKEVGEEFGGLLAAKPDTSPPKEIHALRDNFEEILQEMGVTLVVLIDDLDRCLPETTISTLEAIRLFLFLDNTAFVIAADDAMIKHAVRKHFDGVTDDLVTNYFDKLIQVPVRVPPLGTQEVRAYPLCYSSSRTAACRLTRLNVFGSLYALNFGRHGKGSVSIAVLSKD